MLLVPLANVKTALNITVSDHDDALTALIESISMEFERVTGRLVDKVARTSYLDFEGIRELQIPGFPVDDGQTFKVFYDALKSFGTDTEMDTDLYWLLADRGLLELLSPARYERGQRMFKVEYTGGMAVMTNPSQGSEFWSLYPDVAEATKVETIFEWRQQPNLGEAQVRIASTNVQLNKPTDRHPLWKRILAEYIIGLV